MIRWAWLAVIYLAAASNVYCSDSVRITEVGVKGYYSQEHPARVRVMLLHSDLPAATVQLRLYVHSFPLPHIERVDTFTKDIALSANDRRLVDIPVLLRFSDKATVEVQETDKGGNVLSEDSQALEPPLRETLIATLCVQPSVCQKAQSQISFSGDASEQTGKGKTLKFVAIDDPPEQSWQYAPVKTVVLARPVEALTPAQRDALEGFARQGAALIVIEDEAKAGTFLANYRAARAPGAPSTIGRGKIFSVQTLAGQGLGELYAGQHLVRAAQGWRAVNFGNDELTWVRKRLAVHFRFPRLSWLLAWLAAYILVIGIGNFSVLQKLGRREWGWITVPIISLVFAFAMYLSSALTRPNELRSDHISLLWMDENSPVAFVQRGERISSNRRQTVHFSMTGDAIFEGDRNDTGSALSMGIFGDEENPLNHWKVAFGPPTDVELRLLQWSFRDLEFSTICQQAGNVRRLDSTHFRNETGKNFREALYVDSANVYFLGEVLKGAEIDLSRVRQGALAKIARSRIFAMFGYPTEISEVNREEILPGRTANPSDASADAEAMQVAMQQRKKLFELVELVRGWPADGGQAFDARAGLFFGLADEAESPASLPGKHFVAKAQSVTIISYEHKP